MLADVRLLHHDGERLPRERVAAMQAHRGDLQVLRRRDPARNAWVPLALLVGDNGIESKLPPLDQVRIARWRGADLVLLGVEHVGRPKQQRPKLQAWWVRLVIDGAKP